MAKWFLRRIFFYVSANKKEESSVAAMFLSKGDKMSSLANMLLINVVPFGKAVLEENFNVSANHEQELLKGAMFFSIRTK